MGDPNRHRPSTPPPGAARWFLGFRCPVDRSAQVAVRSVGHPATRAHIRSIGPNTGTKESVRLGNSITTLSDHADGDYYAESATDLEPAGHAVVDADGHGDHPSNTPEQRGQE